MRALLPVVPSPFPHPENPGRDDSVLLAIPHIRIRVLSLCFWSSERMLLVRKHELTRWLPILVGHPVAGFSLQSCWRVKLRPMPDVFAHIDRQGDPLCLPLNGFYVGERNSSDHSLSLKMIFLDVAKVW